MAYPPVDASALDRDAIFGDLFAKLRDATATD